MLDHGVGFTEDAALLAVFRLIADVNLRSGVLSYQHDSQSGRILRVDLSPKALLDLPGGFLPVQQDRPIGRNILTAQQEVV